MDPNGDRIDPPRTPAGAVLLGPDPSAAAARPADPDRGPAGAVEAAVARGLAAVELADTDRGAAALALRLAADLDELPEGHKLAASLGRALGQVLDQLQLTPAARAVAEGKADGQADAGPSPAETIRERSAQRLRAVEGGGA